MLPWKPRILYESRDIVRVTHETMIDLEYTGSFHIHGITILSSRVRKPENEWVTKAHIATTRFHGLTDLYYTTHAL